MLSFKGFLYAVITSATFGLIPLFTIPLLHGGMNTPSILFYRFFIAAAMMWAYSFFYAQIAADKHKGVGNLSLAKLALYRFGCFSVFILFVFIQRYCDYDDVSLSRICCAYNDVCV